MVDYKLIIDQLKEDRIFKLLEGFGANVVDKGDYFISSTICHNPTADGASQKLYYYKNTHAFVCFTECGGMSIFKFLKHYYESHEIDYDWHEDVLKVALSCAGISDDEPGFHKANLYQPMRDKYEQRKTRRQLDSIPEGILDTFVKTYPPEWLSDGIDREAMDKYNIRFSISQNKIIIPHYDVLGRLVGIRGRALDPWEIENLGKYMPVQLENKWYSHPLGLNLYGLNLSQANIKRYGICYVYEAEKSVLQLDGFSFPNCGVAVCGSQFNKFHLDLLMRYCAPKEIVICFDNEEKNGSHDYFNKLWKMCTRYKNYCNFSFIYDRHNLTELKDSPTDNGENIFRKLLNERVRVK